MPTILDIIHDDHENQRTLLSLIAKTDQASLGRRELFAKLSAELRAHQEAERRVLHAALVSEVKLRDTLQEVERQQMEVVAVLDSLGRSPMSAEGWEREFASFRRRVEELLNREEREVLPFAGRVLTHRVQRALARNMRERELELLSAA